METFEKNGYKVTIEQDQDETGPEEFQDEHAFIATTSNRYFEVSGPRGEMASTIGENLEEWEKTHHVYKLNAMIHSGVYLSIASDLKQYHMGFDSGQIGFLLVTRDESEIPHPDKYAEGMVETWNQYLSGDVWGYVIEDGEGNEIGSCWGLYGSDYAETEAFGAVPDNPPAFPYCEGHSVDDWKYEVQNGDTKLGFVEWLDHQKEADEI